MKTIFALAAVAVAASLIGAIPVLHSSFAAQDASKPAANPDSTQVQAVQDNNNDKETNDDNGADKADSVDPQLAS